MRSFATLSAAAFLFASYTVAQQIVPFSTLPLCAQQCPQLNAANDQCVPPAKPQSDVATYTQCICAAPELAPVFQSPDSICTNCPAAEDRQTIQSTMNEFCGRDSSPQPPGTQPTTAGPGGAANTGQPTNNNNNNNNEEPSWISTHWQWIIFAVVLVVGMIGFSILGVWLKRRHRRRVDARNANLASTDATPPPGAGSGNIIDRAGASTPSLPPTAHGSLREMSQSGVAPPRRTFTGRSRSSTANSLSGPGPVAWGPHQNMASTRGYDNLPLSPVYTGTEADERAYGHAGIDTHAVPPPGSAYGGDESVSPVSPVGELHPAAHPGMGRRNTNGAGAQRIREMRSKESVERGRAGSVRSAGGGARTPVSRTGTPNSAGGRRI